MAEILIIIIKLVNEFYIEEILLNCEYSVRFIDY